MTSLEALQMSVRKSVKLGVPDSAASAGAKSVDERLEEHRALINIGELLNAKAESHAAEKRRPGRVVHHTIRAILDSVLAVLGDLVPPEAEEAGKAEEEDEEAPAGGSERPQADKSEGTGQADEPTPEGDGANTDKSPSGEEQEREALSDEEDVIAAPMAVLHNDNSLAVSDEGSNPHRPAPDHGESQASEGTAAMRMLRATGSLSEGDLLLGGDESMSSPPRASLAQRGSQVSVGRTYTRFSSVRSLRPSQSQSSLRGDDPPRLSQTSGRTYSQLSDLGNDLEDENLSSGDEDNKLEDMEVLRRPPPLKVARTLTDPKLQLQLEVQPPEPEERVPLPDGNLVARRQEGLVLPLVVSRELPRGDLQAEKEAKERIGEKSEEQSPDVAEAQQGDQGEEDAQGDAEIEFSEELFRSGQAGQKKIAFGALRLDRHLTPVDEHPMGAEGKPECSRKVPSWPPTGPPVVCLSALFQAEQAEAKKKARTAKRPADEVMQSPAKRSRGNQTPRAKRTAKPKTPSKRATAKKANASSRKTRSPSDVNAAQALLGLMNSDLPQPAPPRNSTPPSSPQHRPPEEDIATMLISLSQESKM